MSETPVEQSSEEKTASSNQETQQNGVEATATDSSFAKQVHQLAAGF